MSEKSLTALNADFITVVHVVALTNAWTPVLPFDPARYAAIFSIGEAAQALLSFGAAGVTSAGIGLTSALPTWECNFEKHPGLVAGPWLALNPVSGAMLYIIEVRYQPEQ